MSMDVVNDIYQRPVHPNTRKCSSDGVHINKSFIDEVQNTVEELAVKHYNSGPVQLTLTRVIFNDPNNWELHFADIPHNRLFVVTHFFSNPYYTKELINSLDDQSYTVTAYAFEFEEHVSNDTEENK